MAETMHILEGEFELTIEGERVWLAPGQTAHVPADAVHETDNVGTGTGRRVVMLSPAGMERFFLVVGAPSKEVAIDGATALSSALRHGWRFVS
jgi:quercetin dioxygenase-like cupin family protein